VFGGSWGSTLALAYAETHPRRVTELVLRGIFLLRRSELLWFYQDGASALFPDAWSPTWAPIPEAERGDMMKAYYRRLTSDDPAVRAEAARAGACGRPHQLPLQRPDHIAHAAQDAFSLAFARIECHYFVHHGFLEREQQLLENVGRLRHIPAVIVQGRYDVVCPLAQRLAAAPRLARGRPAHRRPTPATPPSSPAHPRARVRHRPLRPPLTDHHGPHAPHGLLRRNRPAALPLPADRALPPRPPQPSTRATTSTSRSPATRTASPSCSSTAAPAAAPTPSTAASSTPSAYRIILFDQRGCGQSEPFASLDDNTTWHLVDDIEALRSYLVVDRWQVFGGSWGSTLGVAYAEAHPDRVTELVLRGIFMFTERESEWFYGRGTRMLFPDAWEAFSRRSRRTSAAT
jgi:pimeloyl-ACP methyl ester carboxylesterase